MYSGQLVGQQKLSPRSRALHFTFTCCSHVRGLRNALMPPGAGGRAADRFLRDARSAAICARSSSCSSGGSSASVARSMSSAVGAVGGERAVWWRRVAARVRDPAIERERARTGGGGRALAEVGAAISRVMRDSAVAAKDRSAADARVGRGRVRAAFDRAARRATAAVVGGVVAVVAVGGVVAVVDCGRDERARPSLPARAFAPWWTRPRRRIHRATSRPAATGGPLLLTVAAASCRASWRGGAAFGSAGREGRLGRELARWAARGRPRRRRHPRPRAQTRRRLRADSALERDRARWRRRA